MVYVLVGIAGIVGALPRYYVGLAIGTSWPHPFPMATLLINRLGCFGAIPRFGLSNWLKTRYPSSFPFATLFVNLLGSFLLGYIIGNGMDEMWRLLLGTGFMGAFTTFSTFKLENVQLLTSGKWKVSVSYVIISYTFGILLAFLGVELGSGLI